MSGSGSSTRSQVAPESALANAPCPRVPASTRSPGHGDALRDLALQHGLAAPSRSSRLSPSLVQTKTAIRSGCQAEGVGFEPTGPG